MNSSQWQLADRASLLEEIVFCTGLDASEVEARFAAEEAELGWNVCRDAAHFGVRSHHYDGAMEHLYQQGDGFIFETLQYWRTADRQAWSARGLQRLRARCEFLRCAPEAMQVLMLGDGTGSDTLLLLQAGFRPHYFDVPGSRTSAFSRCRFARRGVETQVHFIEDYSALLKGCYDAVWCFDVIEHLPDLPTAIGDMSRMLGPQGIALITESCEHVRPDLPTHLEINRRYAGRVAELFAEAGLPPRHFTPNTDYRPCEYGKSAWWQLRQRFEGWRLRYLMQRGLQR